MSRFITQGGLDMTASSANSTMTSIASTCAYCGVGCGIRVDADIPQRKLLLRGDEQHPANHGRLCSKGSALADTVSLEGRLLTPKIQGEASDWDTALALVASRFQETIATHGPDAVAFYVSGQLLTEDYYVANKLMKGFIGSGNIDTNSRLCMSSSVAGHKRAFGSDTVPTCYDDIDAANLIVLVGSNTAWCHPIVFQRIKRAKAANPNLKIVVIDPRRTATCDIADLHLPLAHGSDVALFNGLLNWMADRSALNHDYIDAHTQGLAEALAAARLSRDDCATLCDIDPAALTTFFEWFTTTEQVLTFYSQGVNQSSRGSDKVNAIINCHLATGRIGQPGMGPFSLTGQPNAMGGREVGGLANQLAAHMDFTPDNVNRVGRFWAATNMASHPGLKAVDLFDAIHEGTIRAVWIMGTNPVVSLPNADKVAAALARCDFVVASDCIEKTDTNAYAHVLLPAQGWSEKDGTVTNSERRISRQRQLLPAAGMARPDWDIIADVGRRMGFVNGFSYASAAEIFREHAALSGFENSTTEALRDFNISGLQHLADAEYDALPPIQWPVMEKPDPASATPAPARMFTDGLYFTADRKARFIATHPIAPVNPTCERYPLVLNSGRIRDQWHTMTRTALSPKLNQHLPEPFADIHPDTAERCAITPDSLIKVDTRYGTALVRARITDSVRRNEIFLPMHWNRQFASLARTGALVNPAVDPLSGQPELKHTPAAVTPWKPQWIAKVWLAAAPADIDIPAVEYAVKIPHATALQFSLAGSQACETLSAFAHYWKSPTLFNTDDIIEFHDDTRCDHRWAGFIDGNLKFVLFLSPQEPQPDAAWLASLFGKPELSSSERRGILAGKNASGEDCGRIVCACFGVGEKTLRKTIQADSLSTTEQIGACLKAGTNCGSCIPELKALLATPV